MNKESGVDKKYSEKRIVILGLARQGMALARFFAKCGAHVTVSDLSSELGASAELQALQASRVEFVLGDHPTTLLDECDLLTLSGGVPPQLPFVQEAVKRGIPLSNDVLLTCQILRERGLGPIIGITGSSGKTTTTTLVGEMLSTGHPRVHVGGNIGMPLIDKLDGIQPDEPIVLELSSFQLELFNAATAGAQIADIGPNVAAILNITPNHLDRHKDMAAYTSAKLNLLQCMPANGTVILSADDPVTSTLLGRNADEKRQRIPKQWALTDLVKEVRATLDARGMTVLPFGQHQGAAQGITQGAAQGAMLLNEELLVDGQSICRRDELNLRGAHNVSNVLAAAAISHAAGATLDGIRQTAMAFEGVAHRLEVVAEHNGAVWINDSIATSPERALAGLRSFDKPQQSLILLAGGKDKNLPWQTLADEVISNVNYLIGFGAYGPDFVRMVQERSTHSQGAVPTSATAKHLDQAIELAARVVESEKASNPDHEVVVLLSPGGTSYDAYKDFEERGEHFRKLVKALEN